MRDFIQFYSVLFSFIQLLQVFHVREMVSKTELSYERNLLSLSNVTTLKGETHLTSLCN